MKHLLLTLLGALATALAFAQEPQAERAPAPDRGLISIQLDTVPLRDVLMMFSRITGAGAFVLHRSVPDISISVDAKDRPWREVLDDILVEQSLYLKEPAREGMPYVITAVKPGKDSEAPQMSQEEIDAKVAELVPKLGAKDYKTRKEADSALRDMPDEALKAMQSHFKKAKDPEVRMRLKEILQIGLVPGITAEELKRMRIPALEFRQADIHDCLDFLKEAGNKRFQIRTRIAGKAPTVTFEARGISVYEALEIITEVTNLTFSIIDGVVVVHNRVMPE